MESRYYIGYDTKKSSTTNIRFKQGNIDTAVLEVSIFEDGLKTDITGEDIEFRFLKPDGTISIQDSTSGVSIIDAQNGKVECVLRSETLAATGNVKCEVHRSKDGKILNMPTFTFQVEGSIGEGKISENYIGKIENYIAQYEVLNSNVQQYDERMNNLDSQLAEKAKEITWISVKNFKCIDGQYVKGDGEHDDTTGIQACIDYALRNASDNQGIKIIFPVGKYKVTNSLYVYHNAKSRVVEIEGSMVLQDGFMAESGVSILCYTDKPIFVFNLDSTGNATTSPEGAFMPASIRNLVFNGDCGYNAIAWQIHRCRFIAENIGFHHMYMGQKQNLKDSQNWETYSDFSIYRNLRFVGLKHIGMQLWFADATTIENIYNESPANTVFRIIDIRNSEGFYINAVCLNGSDTAGSIQDSAIVYCENSRGKIDSFYSERTALYDSVIRLSASHVDVGLIDLKYNIRNVFNLWKSSIHIGKYYAWTTQITGNYDIKVIGSTTDKSSFVMESADLFKYEAGISQVNANKRGLTRSIPVGYLSYYKDHIKAITFKANGWAVDVLDHNGDIVTEFGQLIWDGTNKYFTNNTDFNNYINAVKLLPLPNKFDGVTYKTSGFVQKAGSPHQFYHVNIYTGALLNASDANNRAAIDYTFSVV